MVTLETPIAPPPAAAAESTSSSCLIFGGWPLSSSRPPADETATAVPIVSKKSLTKSTKMTGTSAHVSASSRLSGSSASPIVEKSLLLGNCATLSGPSSTPKINPSAVLARMPIRIAPRTPRAVSTIITSSPARATSCGPPVRMPRPMPVASLLTVIPASRNPTSAMKRPMPTPIESLISCGTARMIASRRPASTSTSATRPSITTHAIATCQGSLRPRIRSKATTALSPRPDASANGRFVSRPMTSVKSAAASAVATATAANGIVACDRIAGFRKTMYDIVRNVTTPPRTSIRTVEPRSRMEKWRSSMAGRYNRVRR